MDNLKASPHDDCVEDKEIHGNQRSCVVDV